MFDIFLEAKVHVLEQIRSISWNLYSHVFLCTFISHFALAMVCTPLGLRESLIRRNLFLFLFLCLSLLIRISSFLSGFQAHLCMQVPMRADSGSWLPQTKREMSSSR